MKNAFMPSTSLRSRVGMRFIVPLILRSALASLLGLPVIRAPSLSATYSGTEILLGLPKADNPREDCDEHYYGIPLLPSLPRLP